MTVMAGLVLALSFFSFSPQQGNNPPLIDNIRVKFIMTSYYGNNLYIDNFNIGQRFNYDIAVASINNIKRDTAYSVNGNSSFVVQPKVSFTNVGRSNITSSFPVTMIVTPGNYTSVKTIPSLGSGLSTEVTFDNLTITPNNPINIKVISQLSNDQNRLNDTLIQYTLYLPGARRKVVYQAFTSSTCAPCAQNNPYLDAFIAARFDTIVPIKYHMNWPSPGNDPMYLANPTQNNDRRYYYNINAVPTLVIDGVYTQVSGYNVLSNLLNPYLARLSNGSPLSVSVVDTKIAGDSIKSVVTVTILSPLSSGNYKLRVESISRVIQYPSPPGTNGEMIFYDVFRFAYPNSTGISIPTTPGTYTYEYRYKLTPLSGATDTSYYTAAYVQNDNTKEIINANKGRNFLLLDNNFVYLEDLPSGKGSLSPNFVLNTRSNLSGVLGDDPLAGFNYEMFEGAFPPSGWTLTQSVNLVSLYNGANGPTFGGTKSVKAAFYDIQTGTSNLETRIYNNIDLTDSLQFDWAYAPYPGNYPDRLQVLVSTNGGSTYPYTIFDRSGTALATAPATSNSFVPSSSSEWQTFSIRVGSIITGFVENTNSEPFSWDLLQNYPNPFNAVTNIEFTILKDANVTLEVYDVLGNLVATLKKGEYLKKGLYKVSFNAENLSSGIYFYRLTVPDFTVTKKMLLLK